MNAKLSEKLSALKGVRVEFVQTSAYQEAPGVSVPPVTTVIRFEDGTPLSAQFWRYSKGDRAGLSSFDHGQQYGLPAPIDAGARLREELQNQPVSAATLDPVTGDLHLSFADGQRLEVFNFTGYEVWELTFPDGGVEYSTFARDLGDE